MASCLECQYLEILHAPFKHSTAVRVVHGLQIRCREDGFSPTYSQESRGAELDVFPINGAQLGAAFRVANICPKYSDREG